LPRIAPTEYGAAMENWLGSHLEGMYSDAECNITEDKASDIALYDIKGSIKGLFNLLVEKGESSLVKWYPSRLSTEQIWMWITGLYFDSGARGVLAEGYVWYTPKFEDILKMSENPDTGKRISETTFKFWKAYLRSMVERCRTWNHTPECEFPNSPDETSVVLCSCGKGKVNKDFSEGKWSKFSSVVTRVVICPIFAAPFLESSRGGPVSRTIRKVRENPAPKTIPSRILVIDDVIRCDVCRKEGGKKCGACGLVFYCSRACQRKDWKKHKENCKIQQQLISVGVKP
jgi:hypothetical protein